jgi:hypothetical protein
VIAVRDVFSGTVVVMETEMTVIGRNVKNTDNLLNNTRISLMKAQYHLIILALFILLPARAYSETTVAGHPVELALQYGEKMYREGLLPSGVPMKALVMGDIPMDGRMFTCDDCHQRSGLGSEEGTIITWPTSSRELYQPRRVTGAYREPEPGETAPEVRRPLPEYYRVKPARPAYTDETLARVLRSGIDPAGRKLNPIMPKYRFNEENMAIMIHYLKNLSAVISPGVDTTSIHFATIVTEDVPEARKKAMLSVLQAHVDAHNSQSRHEEKRARSGPFYKSQKHKAYRRIDLHLWTLSGPPSGWREQLENYYAEKPVFGLLGGITEGGWEPIHNFCERNRIPALFPITDFPQISDSDWYTLYFSKGYYQEGESSAKYIRNRFPEGEKVKIIQLYAPEKPGSIALARGFEQTWKTLDPRPVEKMAVADYRQMLQTDPPTLFDGATPTVLMAWLEADDFSSLQTTAFPAHKPALIVASSTLFDRDFTTVHDDLKESVLFTYPATLPQDDMQTRKAVKRWLAARNIDTDEFFDIKSKMYFLGWMLPGALKGMRSEYFREYFLEGFDMMIDQDYSIATFPRLTFGPGQRYASKGCYLVRLSAAPENTLVPMSDWVIY